MSSSYGEFEARVSCVRDDEFHEIDDEYQESPSVNDDELQESSSVSNDESHESSESDVGSDNESDGGYPAIYDSNESSESDESDESTGYSSGESTEFSDGKYDSEYNALSDSEVESTLENMGLRRTEYTTAERKSATAELKKLTSICRKTFVEIVRTQHSISKRGSKLNLSNMWRMTVF
jgi:hypothetical protein